MSSAQQPAGDHWPDGREPVPTLGELGYMLDGLPGEISASLRERIDTVSQALAPWSFCDALGDLEAYLAALDDARLMPFEHQIAIKAFVMEGWDEWRKTFGPRRLLPA